MIFNFSGIDSYNVLKIPRYKAHLLVLSAPHLRRIRGIGLVREQRREEGHRDELKEVRPIYCIFMRKRENGMSLGEWYRLQYV